MILFEIIAIVSSVLLTIGVFVYYFASYLAYKEFEEKTVEKLGSKVKLHDIYRWILFNLSMFKSDLALITFLTIITVIFDYNDILYLIIDSVLTIISFVFIKIINDAVRIIYTYTYIYLQI